VYNINLKENSGGEEVMGLDVYLVKYDDFEKTVKLEEEYEKRSDEIWCDELGKKRKTYEELNEKEKEAIRKKCKRLAERMGLNEWGEDEDGKKYIEKPSKKYPDHLFKIGYFRSSYTEGSLNWVLRDLIGKDLSYIFSASSIYRFRPDWEDALERVNEVIADFKKAVKESPYRIIFIDSFGFKKVESRAKAIELVKRYKEQKNPFEDFETKEGYFFLEDPLKVVAALPCKEGVFLVYKTRFRWYFQALEIVKETIEYVLRKRDKNKYYLHWSG